MKNIGLLFVFLVTFLSCGQQQPEQVINLAGEWRFAMDPDNVGITEGWHAGELPGIIQLPGSIQEQGFGNEIDTLTPWTGQILEPFWYRKPVYARYIEAGDIKVPFWLNPEKYYVGVTWFQKEVEIPAAWEDAPVVLNLERPHWETTLFVDGNRVGTQNSLGVPHRYEINGLKTGKHIFTVRVDNNLVIPVGVNAHSVSDHTQSNWNGIVGDISLEKKGLLEIEGVTIYPDVNNKKVRIIAKINNRTQAEQVATLTLKAVPDEASAEAPVYKEESLSLQPGIRSYELVLPMGSDPLLWDEYTPNLYTLHVELSGRGGNSLLTETFGMREWGTNGRRLTINNTPIFLRGTLECCIFPLTGYPAMDEAYWEKIYRKIKEYGLNHIRFHSWCPPEVAFNVADREGIYLQVECNAWTTVGEGTSFDSWVYEEGDRILREYGNHPSFFALLHGNEPGGRNSAGFLNDLILYWKKTDGRHNYSSGAGWPYTPDVDFFSSYAPRIQLWGAGLESPINAQLPQTAYDFRDIIRQVEMPTVSHEIGQWCVYPNFKEIEKYTGVLKAKNFEVFRDELERNHLGDMSEKFLLASGKLQTLCYKADIEAALRTPEFAGFQLLDLHDFPGQGTALIGVLDPFWDDKGYVTGEEFSRFCNRTVPLARMEKLVWKNTDTFKASVEVSHFEKQPAYDVTLNYKVTDENDRIYKEGTKQLDLPVDNCIRGLDIELPLGEVTDAAHLILSVEIPSLHAVNQWDFWVYPDVTMNPEDVYVTASLTNEAKRVLDAGGKVFLTLPRQSVKPEKGGDIQVGFSSIFWNTAWTQGQAPHDLGIYCEPSHPAFTHFPTSYHSDYQWWEIVTGANAMLLDDFPADFRPVVHFIDDWFTSRKLGLVLEANVGNGKLLVCSADLNGDLSNKIAARQFKYSLLEYMKTDQFAPQHTVEWETIRGLLR